MQNDFTTERLSLCALTLNEDAFILQLVNSPGWLQFIGNRNVGNLNDAQAYINKINSNANIKYWVVKLNESETPIGIITFIKRDYLDYHDLGFAFLPEYGKLGYAFEATSTVLNYLINRLLYKHILATTVKDNTSSIQLLVKCGFQFKKEICVDGQDLLVYIFSS